VRRSRLTAFGLGLHGAALALLVVAYCKADDGELEGAYFGGSESVEVITSGAVDRPWIIAAAVLLVVGSAALAAALRR
jgi:hypothetical protein